MSGEICTWIESAEGWETDCGQMITVLHQTPEESGLVRCICCNRPIESIYGTEQLTIKPGAEQ